MRRKAKVLSNRQEKLLIFVILTFQFALDSKCFEYGRHKREAFDDGRVYSETRRRRPPGTGSNSAQSQNFGNPAVGHVAPDGVHRIYNLLSLTGKSGSTGR
jgi:hypothetical protein